jgi:hypothetical protein
MKKPSRDSGVGLFAEHHLKGSAQPIQSGSQSLFNEVEEAFLF